ncbi:MAG: SIMPL domain-containing protein [Pseudomonadota bacterium]
MIKRIAFAAALSALTIPAAQAATIEIEADGPVIELSVYETITAKPDVATIGGGVTTEAPTAVEAMRQNSEAMRAVIDQIKELGVDDDDIQTTGINLNPVYDYNRETRKNVLRGYQVSNRVSVKLRDLDDTGRLLDAIVVAGATDISGPSFAFEADQEAKDEASMRAFEAAMERAKAYADRLGYDEVKVLEIRQSIQRKSPVVARQAVAMVAEAADMSAPVQPGVVSTGVSISVKFELANDED